MGRAKKYHTEEERKEAKKIANHKWRSNNREKVNATQRAWSKKRKELNEFTVYVHYNDNNEVYVGSGSSIRPYQFTSCSRSKVWQKTFNSKPTVEVLKTFENRSDAKEFELKVIRLIGAGLLINQRDSY